MSRFVWEEGDIEMVPEKPKPQLGKMYLCPVCGAQVIVTKAGDGSLECCEKPMEQKK